ncbi:hypothetical protein L9F63_022023, partial [Diploptera punctata]
DVQTRLLTRATRKATAGRMWPAGLMLTRATRKAMAGRMWPAGRDMWMATT